MLLLLWFKNTFSGCKIHRGPVSGVQRETRAAINERAVISGAHFKAIMGLERRQTYIGPVLDGFIFSFSVAFHFISENIHFALESR